LVVILEVAVALGMVIFVHELGHFLVAKACGVKCEKFYLGFDIYGLKFCKLRWGETEYGIGVLPLGGYVKMLGQEDNPARLREEIQRAKQQAAGGTGILPVPGEALAERQSHPAEGQPVDVAAAERALFDPRSYLAKSVPKRMAIISAGVIMNVIFAFLCAVIAYSLGVKQIAAGVGLVFPGEAAWRAGLRVGDQIEEINGQKVGRFVDVMKNISLGDNIAEGIPILVRRPGVNGPLTIPVTPDTTRLRPTIGVGSPFSTTLHGQDRPALPGSPAARAEPKFQSGDRIVQIHDEPVQTYAQIHAYLASHPQETLQVTVERPLGKSDELAAQTLAKPDGDPQPGARPRTTTLTIDVAPRHVRQLGLEMAIGEITAVQADSPAEKAGLRKGDLIEEIDAAPVGDPMTLPERLRRRSGQTVALSVRREGSSSPSCVEVPLRTADWYEPPVTEGSLMTVPQLGIAYRVLNRVKEVTAGSPAAKAGLHAGDVIVQATIFPPDKETLTNDKIEQEEITIRFRSSEQNRSFLRRLLPWLWPAQRPTDLPNWPFFMYLLQNSFPGSRVELVLEDQRKVPIQPEVSAEWFDPDRGFLFDAEEFTETAHSLGEAVELGWRETAESLTMVVAFLRKIGTQISPRALGGPGTIAMAAGHAAYEGIPSLLIFLTLLSANLVVLNFLPIPLLDGGHMLFLAWEGIRGKPADERVQMVLTYLGFLFIVGLMAWVIGLEVGLIPRQVPVE
jgi:regulator of sigma E protease